MVAPRALDSCRRPEGSWALGTRMVLYTCCNVTPRHALNSRTKAPSTRHHVGITTEFENGALIISPVRRFVHTNPEKLSTETELFENALENGGIWKIELCVLVWTENVLKKVLFEGWRHDNQVICLTQSSSIKQKSKMAAEMVIAMLISPRGFN